VDLRGAEWDLDADLYSYLSPRSPTPDRTVYLRAPLPVLLERIRRRGRPFEQQIDPGYLERLGESYDRHFATYPHPLWIVEADQLDFAYDEADKDWIVRQVQQRLGLVSQGGGN